MAQRIIRLENDNALRYFAFFGDLDTIRKFHSNFYL